MKINLLIKVSQFSALILRFAQPLSRVEKNERLQNWFTSIAAQIDALDYNDKTVAGPLRLPLIVSSFRFRFALPVNLKI